MPDPRVPEQGYGPAPRGHAVRPGRPAVYVPPVYAQPPGRLLGHEPRPYGRTSGSGAKPERTPPFLSPDGYERNPYDTYRPSYETPPASGADTRTASARAAARPADASRTRSVPRPGAVPVPGPGPVRRNAETVRAAPAPVVRAPGGRAAARRAERARRAARRPETLRRLVPQALVVAFLAGGTTAFVAHDKTVRLSIDGQSRTLHTFADDVGELLEEQDVHVGGHDDVGPAPRQALADGDEIAVRHGRRVDLTLDGRRSRVWTTARTVTGALRQLGVRAEGARLSTAPDARIGRDGITLEVVTERSITFLADGHEETVTTNAATVLEALGDAGLELGGLDVTSVPIDSFPHEGQTITVMRITGREKVKEERTPFKTLRQADPSLMQGTEVVSRAGRPGLRRVTYRLRTVDGVREKPRRIAVEVLRRPREQIIRVGTRPLPQSVPGADHLDWTALAQCESGGRPDAVDASGRYGGLYQFDHRTWNGLGGSGRPEHAPPEEQTYRAKKLYVSQGASPWPFCGRKLAR
ncbi:ubiquitin-like domain-containing protein [Streptomyces ovatisporus]|uniref:Ubiquitin-like domain-containing protein n=1 Tax=Streptomyces ovatisporus TaxID=1128682 RepID=A0ABV9A3U5_9ACTN